MCKDRFKMSEDIVSIASGFLVGGYIFATFLSSFFLGYNIIYFCYKYLFEIVLMLLLQTFIRYFWKTKVYVIGKWDGCHLLCGLWFSPLVLACFSFTFYCRYTLIFFKINNRVNNDEIELILMFYFLIMKDCVMQIML